MRKQSLWLMVPLLAVSTLFGFGPQDEGEADNQGVEILIDTPQEYLDAVQAFRAKQAEAEQFQGRLQQLRPRQLSRQRKLLRDFDLSGGSLGLAPIDENRIVSPFLAKASGAQVTSVTVNGADSTGIFPGEPVTIVVTFSAGQTSATAELWADLDGNTEFDAAVDFALEMGGSFTDNDFEDEDPAVGVFQITLGPEDTEGVFHVTGLTIFVVVDEGVSTGVGEIFIDTKTTGNPITGTVTPLAANVLIVAFPHRLFGIFGFDDFVFPLLTVTNASGAYTLYLEEPDSVEVFAEDELGVHPGLVPDPPNYSEYVPAGGITGLDFAYITPTAFISGVILNESSVGVEGITVFAFGGDFGGSFEAVTDVNGAYTIGVLPGGHWVDVSDDVIPTYMVPYGEFVEAVDMATTPVAGFTLYMATSTIMGTVTLDGTPLGGIEIEASGWPVGWTYTMSDPTTGAYTLNVSPNVDGFGYYLWPWNWPRYADLVSNLDGIQPGATGVEIAFESILISPPHILSITDVPNDQGGRAVLEFSGGGTEFEPFFGWSIWSVPGPIYSANDMINVGFFLGTGNFTYKVLVPTFVDSNTTTGTAGTNSFESWYVVTGYGDEQTGGDGGFFFVIDSDPMSGWSVDNLVPGVPVGLSLAPITGGGFTLSWEAVTDADLQYYVVKLSDKTTSTESLVATAENAITLTSAELTLANEYDFSVAAVDNNGNTSVYSATINSVTLDLVEGAALPTAYALDANYPNPFNPSTNIQFALPEAGEVSLTIYDLTGRVIQSLASGRMAAGYHRVVWDGRDARGVSVATGVYFYRIVTSGGFVATRKMIFMK